MFFLVFLIAGITLNIVESRLDNKKYGTYFHFMLFLGDLFCVSNKSRVMRECNKIVTLPSS